MYKYWDFLFQALIRLNKMGVTCSPSATRSKLEEMGKDHDKQVLDWKSQIEKSHQYLKVIDVMHRVWPTILHAPWQSDITAEPISDFQTLDFESVFFAGRQQSREAVLKQAVQLELQIPDSVVMSVIEKIKELHERHMDHDRLFKAVQKELCCFPEYQLVVDNIDFEKRAKHMGIEKQNESIHWMSGYAVQLEQPGHHLPDIAPQNCLLKKPNSDFVPSDNDIALLKKEFVILWMRVITRRIPCLTNLQRHAVWHIKHQYSESMENPSSWVS